MTKTRLGQNKRSMLERDMKNGVLTVRVIMLDTPATEKRDSHEPIETQHKGGNIHHEQTQLTHVKKKGKAPI